MIPLLAIPLLKKIGLGLLSFIKNPTVLIVIVAGLIILFQHFTISDKNEKITNLNSTISELESEKETLQTNLDSANTKIYEQNQSILNREKAVAELDAKFEKAQKDKLDLQIQINDMLENSGAPNSNSEAMKWLRDKAREIRTWQNQ